MKEMNTSAYPLVLSVSEISKSLPVIIQSFGIGPLKANTALINWMDDLGKGLSGVGSLIYAENLRIAYREGLNLVILHADENRWGRVLSRAQKEQSIDVWWDNDATSRLMLLLAYLMTRHEIWSKATIRVLSCESGEDNSNDELQKLMEDVRIDAEPVIVQDFEVDTVIKMSSDASFVFMPCRIRDNQVLDVQGGSLLKLLPYLPMTGLAMAAQDIDLEAEPDEGLQGEVAKAQDELSEARDKYEAAKKESEQLQEKSEELTARLVEYSKENEDFPKILKAADQAIEEEENAFRQAAKAKVKAEQAAKTLEQILNSNGKEDIDPTGI